MVFRPALHTKHQGGFLTSQRGLAKTLPPGTFTEGHDRGPDAGSHPPASQAGGAGNTKPYYVRLGKLDGLLRFHRTPGQRSPGQDRV